MYALYKQNWPQTFSRNFSFFALRLFIPLEVIQSDVKSFQSL